MLIENIGWFFIGAGITLIFVTIHKIISLRRQTSKFDKMIGDLKQISGVLSEINSTAEPPPLKHVSELMFRDRLGNIETVRIVVDPAMERDDIEKYDAFGNEFVFSLKMVEDMRAKGLEPDEVVSNILKAGGRML